MNQDESNNDNRNGDGSKVKQVGRWFEPYLHLVIALLAPVFFLYLLLWVLEMPSDSTNGNSDDNSITSGDTSTISSDRTFIESVADAEFYLFVGVFTYPATMVIYFLAKREIKGTVEEIQEDLRSVQDSVKKMIKTGSKFIMGRESEGNWEEKK